MTPSDVPADVTPAVPSMPMYMTEGELIPLKGRWFRVHLNQETKRIELEMLKSTSASEKRAKRKLRWEQQHPHAVALRSHISQAQL